MTTRAVGTVERISEREGKFGPMISYMINGDWYLLKGRKYKERGIGEGTVVEFEFTTNDRGYKDIVKGTMREAGDSAAAPAASSKPATQAQPYKDPRQTIISKQSAMNTALEFVKLAVSVDAVPFTAKKSSDNLHLLTNWVNTEASRIYELNTGEAWEIEAQEPAEVRKPTRKTAASKVEEEPDRDDEGYDEYPE